MSDDSILNQLKNNDSLYVYKINDTRKPVLTLHHLNKIRKFRAMHKTELSNKQHIYDIVYGDDEEGGGMM